MADTKRKVYFDSCCFIDLATSASGHPLVDGMDDHVFWCRKLLDASRDGEIQVYASSLSIAECVGVRNKKRELVFVPEVQRLFKGMLLSGVSGVLPVQPSPLILELARDLTWSHGLSLSGADATHVATALFVECEYFVTTDRRTIGKHSNLAKFKKLGLSIVRGNEIKDILPDDYKQQPLSHSDDEETINQMINEVLLDPDVPETLPQS
jgi:predicted nucleic acid-binding protein